MPKHEAGSKESARAPRQPPLKKSPPAAKTGVGIRADSFPPAGGERAFLQAVEDSVILGIAAFDAEGRQTYANPAFCKIVGWSPEDLLEKEPPFVYWPPEEKETNRLAFRSILGADKPKGTLEMPFQRRGGDRFDALILYSALNDEEGDRKGWVMSVGDLTQRKRADKLEFKVSERTRDLADRLKEMTCLCTVSWLLNQEGLSLEEGLRQAVKAIPPSWRFPEIACARIIMEGREFKTENFRETPWTQTSAIVSQGKPVGMLEVGYLEERPGRDEGPFLNEERTLLDALADQVGVYIERQLAEEALRRSVSYNRTLIEASLDPLVTISPEGKITDVNRAAEFATGVPRGKLIGSDFSDYFTDPVEAREGYERAFRRGSVRDYPLAIRNASGRVTEVLYNATVYRDEAGEVLGVFAAARDVTQRKAMEQELQHLAAALEQISEGLLITDPSGRILYLNKAFETHHGLTRKEAMGSSYLDLMRSGTDEEEKGALAPEYMRGSRGWKGRLKRTSKEGWSGELEITITPVLDPSGEVVNYVAVERDLTQEVKLEEHLRKRQKMEALGTLAGGIAHDFNNILMPILINTEMALLDVKQKVLPSPDYLQLVRDAANRGQELVNQIITYSRQKEQPRNPVNILPIVKEALKFLRATIPANIEIRPSIGVESGLISADPTQVHQVLMNLCSNAAYAMREEGGILEVALVKVEVDPEMAGKHDDLKPGPYLRLTVRDNGRGMDRAVRERAFDPFFTTKKPSEGTGMGLAVVHGIVKNHEGAVILESEVGKGTTAQVFLPWVQAVVKNEFVARGELTRGNERILLIDDEEIQVRTLQHMLERLGYRITGKTDPRQALEAFQAQPDAFDLVITDQTMPELTGAVLARELLRLRPDLPIILATGFSDAIDEEGARTLGVRDFAMKPLNVRDLAGRIRKALKK